MPKLRNKTLLPYLIGMTYGEKRRLMQKAESRFLRIRFLKEKISDLRAELESLIKTDGGT